MVSGSSGRHRLIRGPNGGEQALHRVSAHRCRLRESLCVSTGHRAARMNDCSTQPSSGRRASPGRGPSQERGVVLAQAGGLAVLCPSRAAISRTSLRQLGWPPGHRDSMKARALGEQFKPCRFDRCSALPCLILIVAAAHVPSWPSTGPITSAPAPARGRRRLGHTNSCPTHPIVQLGGMPRA